MVTAVKICGVTRDEDAQTAVRLGARALGFIFYAPSPRNIDVRRAAQIVRDLPPFVSAVGLFVNADEKHIENVLAQVPLDLLQFHGDEAPAFCARFRKPYIKAIRVRPQTDLLQYAGLHSAARALLLDAFVDGKHGGTGTVFDWSLIPHDLPLPVILSGGLNAGNVADAIRRVAPWAVDVSSGVEATAGIKDPQKIAAFMREVCSAVV
jgi:phosphoribosylanthranilate isomerase